MSGGHFKAPVLPSPAGCPLLLPRQRPAPLLGRRPVSPWAPPPGGRAQREASPTPRTEGAWGRRLLLRGRHSLPRGGRRLLPNSALLSLPQQILVCPHSGFQPVKPPVCVSLRVPKSVTDTRQPLRTGACSTGCWALPAARPLQRPPPHARPPASKGGPTPCPASLRVLCTAHQKRRPRDVSLQPGVTAFQPENWEPDAGQRRNSEAEMRTRLKGLNRFIAGAWGGGGRSCW